MGKIGEVYKCNVCGHIIEIVHEGMGQLVCCNQPMQKLEGNTEDAAQEKHVPVIDKTESGVKVRIGSVEHPMESSHYIEWIEITADGKVYRKFLKPGDKPEADFCVKADRIEAREYCNLHGLWKKTE